MTGTRFISVVCGLKSEAAVVRAAAPTEKIRVAVSGASAKRTEELTAQMCKKGARAVVSAGISGGLDPALSSGALLIGEKVLTDDGTVYTSDRDLLRAVTSSFEIVSNPHPEVRAPGLVPGASLEGWDASVAASRSSFEPRTLIRGSQKRLRMRDACAANGAPQNEMIMGALFGSDEIVETVEKKAALFANHGCLAVDMESHGAARAAGRAGVPFLAIRAVADPSDRALPEAALNAVADDGSTRTFATLAAAVRDPKQFPELMKLGADSRAALKTLRRSLGPLFGRLFLALDL
ncbi:MAG: hypothetical protein ACE5FO_01505 [Parvularculaceae bacterium]